MHVIGGSRRYVIGIMASEILLVLITSVVLANILTLLTSRFGSAAIRLLIV